MITGDDKTIKIVDYLSKIVPHNTTQRLGIFSRLTGPVDMSLREAPIHFQIYLIDDR